MMFNNNQNNAKDNSNDTNTRGLQFKNKDGFEPSTVSIGFWNDLLTIRINPALPPEAQTENRIYDYNKYVSTALTVEKITLLHEKIKNEVIPAIEKDEECTVGIPVAGDSLFIVSTGKSKHGVIKPYMAIVKGINPDTKKAEMVIHYEFNKTSSVDNYNPDTGSYDINKNGIIELLVFDKILEASIWGLSKVFVHADRAVNKFFNNKQMQYLTKIMEKLGIPVDYYNGNKFNSKANVFENNNTGGNSYSNDTEMNVSDSLDALDEDLPF